MIAEYFTAQVGESKPEKLTLTYDLKQPMRYGENPQQDADFYQKALPTDYSISSAKQLNGKELSLTISVMRMRLFVSSVILKTVQPLWLSNT